MIKIKKLVRKFKDGDKFDCDGTIMFPLMLFRLSKPVACISYSLRRSRSLQGFLNKVLGVPKLHKEKVAKILCTAMACKSKEKPCHTFCCEFRWAIKQFFDPKADIYVKED